MNDPMDFPPPSAAAGDVGQPLPRFLLSEAPVTLNAGRDVLRLTVTNHGDRPIQVGSHYHFAEVNRGLRFDRVAAVGRRLNIPAGTAARFEPGDTREVELVPFAGGRRVIGFSGHPDGLVEPARLGPPEAASTPDIGSPNTAEKD